MKLWFRLLLYYTLLVVLGLLDPACKHRSTNYSSDPRYQQSGISLADSILSLPAERQMLGLLKWYRNTLVKKDSESAMAGLGMAEQAFREKNQPVLQRQLWLMQYVYRSERLPYGEPSASLLLEAAGEAASMHWTITQAECWHYAGSILFKAGIFVPAFEYLRKAQNVFDNYNNTGEYSYLLRYAGGLALCYYQFGEYREAIHYLEKEMRLPSYWSEYFYFPDLKNTIGLCYQQLKNYDSAAYWYQQSHDMAAIYKDSFYMALANGNLGYSYYLQQHYDKALPLLLADYAASSKAGETGSATNAASALADIYIKTNKPEEAQEYLNITREYTFATRSLPLLKNWYEELYHLSQSKGDYKTGNIYADSLIFYKDSLNRVRDKKAFNQEVLKLETEKHMHEVSQLEAKRKNQVLLRNSLMAVLVLLTIIALLAVNRQLLKRNKERELAQQQLEFAGHELQAYMQQLKEKNELLEQLRDDVDRENNSLERTGNINRLISATILTEEDWKKFQLLFEKVYPGFFIRLREKMPDLSATDTRLLALTKLQVAPKDMSAMLGVSYDAVRKARQRLRKKINLPEEGGLDELVNMI